MSCLNRITTSLSILAVLVAGSATPALAAEDGQDPVESILVVYETDWYADGTSVNRAPYAIGATIDGVYAADLNAKVAATGLSIRNTLHWLLGQNFSYKVTQYLLDQKFRKQIKKALAADVNKPRGTPGTPKQSVTKKKTRIMEIEDFANPFDFYFQKDFNSVNEIIMTEDDQFFLSFPGQVPFDPGPTATTRRFGFGQCTRQDDNFRQGGKIVCTFFNVEADVYMRSNFFDLPKTVYEIVLAAIFRQTLG